MGLIENSTAVLWGGGILAGLFFSAALWTPILHRGAAWINTETSAALAGSESGGFFGGGSG